MAFHKGWMMKIALVLWLICISLFAEEVTLPAELAAWKSLSYVKAAKSAEELPNAVLTVGTASFIGLYNTPKVTYVLRPVNEGGTVSYGGIFQIVIKEGGVYRVALGNGSWIDMVKEGKAAKSIAHKGGPKNSGIGKMLDFALEAGTYTLQFSAGGDSTSAVLVTKIK